MSSFFRFPHTPNLAWLGQGSPRDDKVLMLNEAAELLRGDVVVEEKLDGANLGFSIGSEGRICAQNRGQYLENPFQGQFSRLTSWLDLHQDQLTPLLGQKLILFGEWCAARHSLVYTNLPDWFVVFDVYDRETERFWSTSRRDLLVKDLGMTAIPKLFVGQTTLKGLEQLLSKNSSSFFQGPMEGLIIRREDTEWLSDRAKLVRADFTQAITEHWSRRKIEWNKIIIDRPSFFQE
jgi:ATP-dependent RNA circularization protein (DNA/RNA ligase family)